MGMSPAHFRRRPSAEKESDDATGRGGDGKGGPKGVTAGLGVPSTLKVLANYLLHAGLHAVAEAVGTAQAAGLPDDLIRDFFEGLAPSQGIRLPVAEAVAGAI